MLSNAYFLAKFRFDKAENEPAKNLQKLQNKLLLILHDCIVQILEVQLRWLGGLRLPAQVKSDLTNHAQNSGKSISPDL